MDHAASVLARTPPGVIRAAAGELLREARGGGFLPSAAEAGAEEFAEGGVGEGVACFFRRVQVRPFSRFGGAEDKSAVDVD